MDLGGRHPPDVPLCHVPGDQDGPDHRRALLAFALSFDEVIVTTFTAGTQETIPLWIFDHIRLGRTDCPS